MSWSERLAALVVAAVVAAPSWARADKATADAAFEEGRKLIAAGKVAEACPKFELSYEADPQLGTLLNLADCHERLGKLATAWAEFKAAAELARKRKDKRAGFAEKRKEKLDGRISHVVIEKTADPAGLRVYLDDRDVTALIGVEVPIDPGKHVVSTQIGDGPKASTEITVEGEGSRLEVSVPVAGTAWAADPQPRRTGNSGSSIKKPIGLVVGGLGLVATGVGLYFGKQAYDRYDESRPFCEDNLCDDRGAELVDDARALALRSNILVGVGVGAVATGLVLWLTAPSGRSERAVTARPVVTPAVVGGSISVGF